MFVTIAALCVFLGMRVRPVERQRKANLWVNEMHGRVLYDYEVDDKGSMLSSGVVPPGPVWLRERTGADYLARTVSVKL
jgi:hypothetical protein